MCIPLPIHDLSRTFFLFSKCSVFAFLDVFVVVVVVVVNMGPYGTKHTINRVITRKYKLITFLAVDQKIN